MWWKGCNFILLCFAVVCSIVWTYDLRELSFSWLNGKTSCSNRVLPFFILSFSWHTGNTPSTYCLIRSWRMRKRTLSFGFIFYIFLGGWGGGNPFFYFGNTVKIFTTNWQFMLTFCTLYMAKWNIKNEN